MQFFLMLTTSGARFCTCCWIGGKGLVPTEKSRGFRRTDHLGPQCEWPEVFLDEWNSIKSKRMVSEKIT